MAGYRRLSRVLRTTHGSPNWCCRQPSVSLVGWSTACLSNKREKARTVTMVSSQKVEEVPIARSWAKEKQYCCEPNQPTSSLRA